MISITKGNIFNSDCEAIVNTVNCVGVMGKGLALEFKKQYPINYHLYQKECDNQDVKIGKMFITETGYMVGFKYIINFPTKIHWKDPSKLSYVTTGLQDLHDRLIELKIESIAVPALGCGLGGLYFNDIYYEIKKHLSDLENINIKVYAPESYFGD